MGADGREPSLVQLQPGVEIERDVFDIVSRVSEYDPNLRIQFIPPELGELGDAPYRLVEHCKDGVDRVVFYIWQLDASVLERIYAADCQKRDLQEAIEKKNAAAKRDEVRRYRERMEEAKDMFLHAFNTRKTKYTIKDGDRVIEV